MVVAQEREDKKTVTGTRWYIVHAYTNFERKVADAIRERAKAGGLDNLFEEIVVPTEEVVEVKRGRKIPTERKFLPGYVLVKMKMTDAAFVMQHSLRLTGLTPNGTYYYRITAVDHDDEVAVSTAPSFSVPGPTLHDTASVVFGIRK